MIDGQLILERWCDLEPWESEKVVRGREMEIEYSGAVGEDRSEVLIEEIRCAIRARLMRRDGIEMRMEIWDPLGRVALQSEV